VNWPLLHACVAKVQAGAALRSEIDESALKRLIYEHKWLSLRHT
jgi:hypothetical protein